MEITLEKISELLTLYSPRAGDRPKVQELSKQLSQIEQKIVTIDAIKSEKEDIAKAQKMIEDGSIDCSNLSEKDKYVLPSVQIHPIRHLCLPTPAFKISFGWPASKIKPALPEFFDDNLAQDLAEFADSEVEMIYKMHGHVVYKDHYGSSISIILRSMSDKQLREAKRKANNTFPILNQIVNFEKILCAVSRVYSIPPRYNVQGIVNWYWPLPDHFSFEDKMLRYMSYDRIIAMEAKLQVHEITCYGWKLTEEGGKEIIKNIKENGVESHKAFLQAQRELVKKLDDNVRNPYSRRAAILDSRGVFCKEMLSKELEKEKQLEKIEKKHGVKRKLELAEGETKGECKICKKKITAGHWNNHVTSRTHMKKALKLK